MFCYKRLTLAMYGWVCDDPLWNSISDNSFGVGCEVEQLHMPGTAIVAIYTSEGFVLAADGRKKQGQDTITENEQKIFPVDRKRDKLAYALAGITSIPKEESSETLFDFREDITNSLSSLRNEHTLSFAEFVRRLAGLVNMSLESLWKEHPGLPFPMDNDGEGSIAHLLIVGYYGGTPVIGRISPRQKDCKLLKTPTTGAFVPLPGERKIMVPLKLGMALHNGDERLSDYITEPVKKMLAREAVSLQEAQGAAVKCITACTDQAAREIDPDSETVGGTIHLATITESAGFSWVIPPTQWSG